MTKGGNGKRADWFHLRPIGNSAESLGQVRNVDYVIDKTHQSGRKITSIEAAPDCIVEAPGRAALTWRGRLDSLGGEADNPLRLIRACATMDVGDWVRGLGLGQYEAVFRENEIDTKVLTKLTTEDLKDLGVTIIGHRRTILSAIEELSTAPPPQSAPAPEMITPTTADESAERRQLTVMFCDLVGSTAMAARLPPEDMRGVVAAYHKCCSSLITRNGGFVAKYMGDGVLAYFGYPQAHEHDAEHAVRSGLAIVEAAPKIETSVC